jgi:hypothetical protein
MSFRVFVSLSSLTVLYENEILATNERGMARHGGVARRGQEGVRLILLSYRQDQQRLGRGQTVGTRGYEAGLFTTSMHRELHNRHSFAR